MRNDKRILNRFGSTCLWLFLGVPNLLWVWIAFCALFISQGPETTFVICTCAALPVAVLVLSKDRRRIWEQSVALRRVTCTILAVIHPVLLSIVLGLVTLAFWVVGPSVEKGELLYAAPSIHNQNCALVVSGVLSNREKFEIEVATLQRDLRDSSPDVVVIGYYVPSGGLVQDFLVGWPEWCLSLCSLRSPVTKERSMDLCEVVHDYRQRNNRVCLIGHSHGNILIGTALQDLNKRFPDDLVDGRPIAVMMFSRYAPNGWIPDTVPSVTINSPEDPVAAYPWNFHQMWRGWEAHRFLSYIYQYLKEISKLIAIFEVQGDFQLPEA